MVLNKKGIFFTTLVLLMLTLLILSYGFVTESQKRKTIEKRVETMNDFLSSTEENMKRQLYIIGFRSVFLFEKYIVEKNQYITNLNSTFEEVFFNGTLYGEETEDIRQTLEGAIFPDIINRINENAEKINVDITFTNPNVTISQDDPWNIKITLNSTLTMIDKGNLSIWNKTSVITAHIPITSFNDPIYTKEADKFQRAFLNKINKSIYSSGEFVIAGDASNLANHATNSYYHNTTEAPSFLQRLQGQMDENSPYGIESFVNLADLDNHLSQYGTGTQSSKSAIDHVYFNPNVAGTGCSHGQSGLPSWFEIDSAHASEYQLSC